MIVPGDARFDPRRVRDGIYAGSHVRVAGVTQSSIQPQLGTADAARKAAQIEFEIRLIIRTGIDSVSARSNLPELLVDRDAYRLRAARRREGDTAIISLDYNCEGR